MSKTKSWKNQADKRPPGPYVALARVILLNEEFAKLSPYACKLLFDLLSQYSGQNNGNLCASWTLMKERDWRSRGTLQNAKMELIDKNFVIVTRQGGRNKATLLAFSFFAIDECYGKDLEVRATTYPPGGWGHSPKGNDRRISSAHGECQSVTH